jgi:amino acid transporter
MEHVKALLVKFVMLLVVLGIVLTGIFDVEFEDTLTVTVVLTLVAYLIGDLMIFRKMGDRSEQNKRNLTATLSDAVLTFIVVWAMGNSLFPTNDNIVTASLVSAIAVAVGEWFYHKYLDDHVFEEKQRHAYSQH